MDNLMDGVLKERDRLQGIKNTIGDEWDRPEFFFYRSVFDQLMKASSEAVGGRMEVTDMLRLYEDMKAFDA